MQNMGYFSFIFESDTKSLVKPIHQKKNYSEPLTLCEFVVTYNMLCGII